MRPFAFVLLFAAALSLPAQSLTAFTADPAPDKANPPTLEAFQLPSHGSPLNALMYVASGAGPHPTVILLHGFPGNEKNLDLAQTIRRAGWNVLYFNYRGSWGSPGAFSFTHAMEDTQAAIAYLRVPENASKLRTDPRTLVLIGHSMGAWIAAWAAAHDPAIRAAALISSAPMSDFVTLPPNATPAQRSKAVAATAAILTAQGMAPLAGCTPQSLAEELLAHITEWHLTSFAPALTPRPFLFINSDDGLAFANEALAEALTSAGDTQTTTIHIATDHSYSGSRIQLQQEILKGLDYLNPQP